MTNALRLTLLFFILGIFSLNTGCARQKKTSKINALEAQVNQMTDEIVRMDQSIQELRASTAASEGRGGADFAGARSTGGSSLYRTPSGFELPSNNIQRALKNAGYYQGNIDGKIGSGTKDAVKAFQKDNGLEADGVVGRRTWDKLKDYLGGGAASVK